MVFLYNIINIISRKNIIANINNIYRTQIIFKLILELDNFTDSVNNFVYKWKIIAAFHEDIRFAIWSNIKNISLEII